MTRSQQINISLLASTVLFLIHSLPVNGEEASKSQGIKIDREVIELLNKPTVQLSPSQIQVFRECQDEKAGLFFFITPIMTYLESQSRERTVTRFFNAEQLDRAIRAKLKKEGTSLEMFCGHIVAETEKARRGEYSYGDILDHILQCQRVCGPVMSAMASVYMYNSARYYQGLVRFNYDDASLYGRFQGDFSHGHLSIDNESQLEAVYREWVASDRALKIGLDGRASQPGGTGYNDELSRRRLAAVEKWFTEVKDVPASMIDRKWFGNYGPFIDGTVADLYSIQPLYAQYRKNNQAAKSQLDGRAVYYGLNQSVALFLYEDKDIHIETEPVY